MKLERRLSPRTAIDMTPLIDVIMQLIIFFMITTTFRTAPGIALSLPGSSTARPVPQGEIRIVAVSASELYVDGEPTDLAGLDAAVGRAVATRRAAPAAGGEAAAGAAGSGAAAGGPAPLRALLEARSDAEYQLVVSAMDALRRNGIDAVGLATATGRKADEKP